MLGLQEIKKPTDDKFVGSPKTKSPKKSFYHYIKACFNNSCNFTDEELKLVPDYIFNTWCASRLSIVKLSSTMDLCNLPTYIKLRIIGNVYDSSKYDSIYGDVRSLKTNDENIKAIQIYFECSRNKAIDYLGILNENDIEKIKIAFGGKAL